MASQVIRTIYLDMDDVCNTLAPHIAHFMGCPIQPDSYDNYPGQFGYATEDVVNHFLGTKFTVKGFWPILPQFLWASVPTTDFFPWLLETCCSLVGEENVILATRPILSPACVAGKMEWILEFCPPWLQKQISISTCKERLAQSDALLIDDHEGNIQQFCARYGWGIIVPRPWNCLSGRDPQSHIASCLKKFEFYNRGPLK